MKTCTRSASTWLRWALCPSIRSPCRCPARGAGSVTVSRSFAHAQGARYSAYRRSHRRGSARRARPERAGAPRARKWRMAGYATLTALHLRRNRLSRHRQARCPRPRAAQRPASMGGFQNVFSPGGGAGCRASRASELMLYPGGYGGIQPVESGIANLCCVVQQRYLARAGNRWENFLAKMQRDCPTWP